MALFMKNTPADTPPNPMFNLHRTLPNPVYNGAAALPVTRPPWPWKKWLKRTAITLLIVLMGLGGYMGWKLYNNSGKIFGGNLFGLLQSDKLDGEDKGRVNILVIGNSADDPNHGGAKLTDSIMVVSLNTQTNKAVLISLPRDLYVEIPNNGYAKINEAYQDGEENQFSLAGYPEGGPGMLEKVVEDRLAIDINYYALLNYAAFRDTVNALDGITVTINSSSPRGIYDPNIAKVDGGPLRLSNGPQTLDGQTALNLARARGAAGGYGLAGGDFDRAANQRLMLVALKDKATSGGTLANPLKIADLLDALGSNIKTNLTTSEARRLYDISKLIDNANIASASINGTEKDRLLKSYRTPRGQAALVPAAGVDDYSDIQSYIKQLMASH